MEDAMIQLGEQDPSTSRKKAPHRTMTAPVEAEPGARTPEIMSSTNRAVSYNFDERTERNNRRGRSRDPIDTIEEDGVCEQGVPRNIGPRMGGLQKQVSEITLDSMFALDVEPQASHADRINSLSLDNIVEDDSSHHRNVSDPLPSTSNIDDSRVGAFPLEGSAMERLEARILAKRDAPAVETRSHHVHFNNTQNVNQGLDEQSPLFQEHLLDHDGSNSRSEKPGSGGLGRPKTDESIGGGKPGVVNMTGDRLNIFESRIRRKHAQSLVVERSSSTEKRTGQSDLSRSEHSGSGEKSEEKSWGFNRSKTLDSEAHDSLPGTAVNMTGDRLNVYEERIRRKNTSTPRSDNLVFSERSGSNAKVEEQDKDFHRSRTEGSGTQDSIPRTAVNMTGDRLLIPQESKPGIVNMQGDLLNLYERRIQRKNEQSLQSNVNKGSLIDEKASHSGGSHSTGAKSDGSGGVVETSSSSRIETDFKRSKTIESGAGSSTPGVVHYNASEPDRKNLFEQRIQEKNIQQQHEASRHMSSDSTFAERLAAKMKEGAERTNLYERRIQEKKETDESARQSKLASSVGSESHNDKVQDRKGHHHGDTENALEFEELCEIRNSGNCDDIIGVLRLHSHSLASSTILFAFECIREMLTASDKPHLFRSKVSWIKLFSSLMYTHFSDETIQSSALATLWSIASYSSRHAQDINANDEIMELIIDVMEIQSEFVNEYGSGLIGCLAVSESDALSILERCDGCLVQRLMSTLTSKSQTGVSHLNAMRALLRLSTVYHQNHQGFFGNLMGRHLVDDEVEDCPSAKAIGAVLDSLHQHPSELLLQTEGSRLLCQLFSRDAIIDDDVFFLVIDGVLHHIESMSTQESRNSGLDEAILCLLSNISTYACDNIEDFLSLVLKIMAVSTSSSSALHGCRFIYNLCSSNAGKRARFAIGDSGGINIILKLMSTFKGETEVTGEACGAIFAICFESPSNKKKVVDLGGVKSIYFSIDESGFEDDANLSLNIRACAGKN
jgi:hypothetical protein